MDLKELKNILNQRQQQLGYEMWREANLIAFAVSDIFSKKNKSNYPVSPEDACPELFPPKKTIKRPSFLYGNKFKSKGGMIMYE